MAVGASGDLIYFAHQGNRSWKSKVVAKSAHGRYQSPALAVAADGTVLVTAFDTAGYLESVERAPGQSSWTAQQVATGIFGTPSVTTSADGSESYLGLLTATSGGTLYFWWAWLGVPGWQQETIASPGAGGSFARPSDAINAQSVVVTAVNTSGGVDFWSQQIGGTGWGESLVTGSGGTFAHPVIGWTGPVSDPPLHPNMIVAGGPGGQLDYWWTKGGSFFDAETIAGAAGRQPTPARRSPSAART